MKIENVQKMVRKGVTTPKFRPNKWKHAIGAGCYPYALDVFQNEFVLVGEMVGERCNEYVSDEKLLSVLEKELVFLGFNVKRITDISIPIQSDEIRILLKREKNTGYYHFIRQDEDGTWSHKDVNRIPTKIEVQNGEGWCFQLKKQAS